MIPKIIHQIFYPVYFTDLPQQWADNIAIWKDMHPDYQHKLWGYEESLTFLRTFYPSFVKVWLGYPHPIQRCDAIRYFLLRHYGGVYADLDLIPLKPIDPLMVYDALIPESSIGGGFSNSFLGCVPNHSFFRSASEQLFDSREKYWFLGKHIHVMYSTGPAFLTNVHKSYSGNDIFVICSKVYYKDCGPCVTTNSLCKGYLFAHTNGKSWNKWDTKLINHLYCRRKDYLIVILLIMVVLLWYYGFYKKCKVVCQA